MKFLAVGFGLLSVLLLSIPAYRIVRLDTFGTKTAEVSSLRAAPKMLPRRPSGSKLDLSAGTVVSVTLGDPIDSDHDPSGKQYAASVNFVDGQAIAPGSRATVSLLHNNTGWLTQLTGLTIHGRKFEVLSDAGSVVITQQDLGTQQDSKPSPSRGILERVSFMPATKPASDQPVLLPPATQLRFVLIGGTTPSRADTANPRHTTGARTATDPGLSPAASIAASLQEPGTAYLCSASDMPDHDLPAFYYVTDAFDSKALVERRWHDLLVTTYPYWFADNHDATGQCKRLANAVVVETRGFYALGPSPYRASLPAASTLPSRRTQ